MRCVEVVRGPEASDDVVARSVAFVESLGKTPVVLEKETHDPADLPSRTVTELVAAGHLGRKTGRGFYTYDTAGA